jgi:hypothetical protein
LCGAVDSLNLGTYTGISRLEVAEWEMYVIRKGDGAYPWGTETLQVDRDAQLIYFLGEVLYDGVTGAVLYTSDYWRRKSGRYVPGTIWMPLVFERGAGRSYRKLGVVVDHNVGLVTIGRPTGVDGPIVEWPPERLRNALSRVTDLGPQREHLGGSDVIQFSDRMGGKTRFNVESYWLARTPNGPVIYSRWIHDAYEVGRAVRLADSVAVTLHDCGPPRRVRVLCPDGIYRWLGTSGFGPTSAEPFPARRPGQRVEEEKSKTSNRLSRPGLTGT